jgi:hypothetical protein
MLTDSKCKTREILKRFVTENPDFEKARTEILNKFDLYIDDFKRLIDSCTVIKTENEYQITITKKDSPHIVFNYPIDENGKLIFIEEV